MKITIRPQASEYDIILRPGVLSAAGKELKLDRKVLIVTDDGVPREYAEAIAGQCKEAFVERLPSGEATKCLTQFQRLLSAMLAAGFTRGDCAVAVGGGVVGDLTGFAASCYMRGIDFYNVPTTLLAQVDSSIGGKTAIDLDGVKNVAGTFYQPKKVLIDPDTLRTLDPRQQRAGLAEAIKMALTCDAELLTMIEQSRELPADLPAIIEGALRIKKSVVEQDPQESGLRRVLNFGHTVGHAIESVHGGALLHGECVALGMLPMCAPPVRRRLMGVLEKYGLPTRIEQSAETLLPYILHDKKLRNGLVATVFVDEVGSFRLQNINPAELAGYLEALT